MRSGWLQCVVVALSLVFFSSCGSSSKSGFIYLVTQGTSPGLVSHYSVNLGNGLLNSNNGALVQTGNSAKAGTQPTVMIFDPTSSFGYVANFVSDDISLFTVNKDGSLTAASSTTRPTPTTIPSSTTIARAAGRADCASACARCGWS